MRVAFRADGSIQIGSGHVMRCLTLADELVRRDAKTHFIARSHPGHLAELIRQRGYDCTLLPALTGSFREEHKGSAHRLAAQDANETTKALMALGDLDWLVVDHYALDAVWEESIRRLGPRILAIDDLADRPHHCDILLDQNLQARDDRYDRLLPETCLRLLGPTYALLRPQFAAARKTVTPRSGKVERILVSFGGSDPDNLTATTLDAVVETSGSDLAVDVVLGPDNPRRQELEARCARTDNVTGHWNVTDMAALMAIADLSVGAVGATTWERACLGLPAIVVTIADNQRPTAACAERRGILQWLGDAGDITAAQIATALRAALAEPDALATQSHQGMAMVDGDGAVRVAEAMSTIKTAT